MTNEKNVSQPMTIYVFLAYGIIVFVSVAHLLQVIFMTGTERIPGDLGDSRFNNLILEHLWHSLNGRGEWASPPMYYPVKNTLFFSDAHLGTFSFYAFFRFLGWSMESALQGWSVVLAVLNAASLVFVFRHLRLPLTMTAALTLFGSSHFAFVGNTGHLQLLPIFPTVFLVYFFCRFLYEGKRAYFLCAVVFSVYQHFCTPYYGYFSFLLLGIFLIIFGFFHSAMIKQLCFNRLKKADIMRALGVLCIAFVALGWFYLHYYQASAILEKRDSAEVAQLTPTWRAWVTAMENSVFYNKMQHLPGNTLYGIELSLFTGFISCFGFLVLFALSWKYRHTGRYAAVAFPLLFSILITIILITRWPGFENSIYMFFVVHFPGIRAFRALGRILYLMLPLMALASAFLYSGEKIPITIKRVLYVLSILMAIEALSRPTFSYSKSDAQERTRAMAEAFSKVSDNSVVAFAPGATGQTPLYVDIDAMCGAWAKGVPVLNGYSGGTPQTHKAFCYSLQSRDAHVLAEKVGVRKEDLVIINEYPEWFSLKHNLFSIDVSKPFITLVSSVSGKHVSIRAGEKYCFEVTLKNQLIKDVPCSQLNLNLAYKLFAGDGYEIWDPHSLRTTLSLLPATSPKQVTMCVQAPEVPGIYRIRVSMVCEGYAWWFELAGDHGFDFFLISN